MGTFEKAYIVDGLSYELYRQEDDSFELVSVSGHVVGRRLLEIPDETTVLALVREYGAAA